MRKCELSVRVEQGERLFEIGDTVRGVVRVRVDAACRCNGLVLWRGWKTHGKGNPAEDLEDELLFRGEWERGVYRYPFEFVVSPGPVTYRGHYVNVDRVLRATADIPWAFDPQAETEYLVQPSAPGYQPVPPAPDHQPLLRFQSVGTRSLGNGMLYVGLIGLAIGGLWLASSVSSLVRSVFWTQRVPSVVGAASLTLIAALFVFFFVSHALAERKLGLVSADVTPTLAAPGDRLHCDLDFTPRMAGRLNRVTVTLRGEESATSGSGTNTRTWLHAVDEQVLELAGPQDLTPGDPVDLRGTFSLPDHAPFSLRVPDNSVLWTVSFHIDVANWPDWHYTQPLVVLPRSSIPGAG